MLPNAVPALSPANKGSQKSQLDTGIAGVSIQKRASNAEISQTEVTLQSVAPEKGGQSDPPLA